MMPRSHSSVLSSPHSTLMPVTMAWNEALVGGQPIRPFHFGSVKSQIESGRSASVSALVLYTTTLARPEMPTHLASGERAHAGASSRISVGRSSSSSSTVPSPPGSCAKNRSAGDLLPSSNRVAASSPVDAYLTFTFMPVASRNCWMIGSTRDSLRPEYTTSSSLAEARPHATVGGGQGKKRRCNQQGSHLPP